MSAVCNNSAPDYTTINENPTSREVFRAAVSRARKVPRLPVSCSYVKAPAPRRLGARAEHSGTCGGANGVALVEQGRGPRCD
jgi:hypothetical protein